MPLKRRIVHLPRIFCALKGLLMIPRRTFLRSLSVAPFVAKAALAKKSATSPKPTRILIGTNGRGAGTGIFSADWNVATGELSEITLAAEVGSPTFLALHKRGEQDFVYAVNEGGRGGIKGVSAFTSVAGAKTLKLLNQVDTEGNGPTHISVTPDGNSVFVANYGGGSASSFHVRPDGSLSPAVSHFQYEGSGPNKERQMHSFAHCVMPSPDGRYLLVNDLGLDCIHTYRVNPATAELTPTEPPSWIGRPGTGPRHTAFSPDAKFLYSVNELDSTVDILTWDASTGTLKSKGFVSSLPAGFPPNTAFAGEITVSRDGKFVYVGNRVADDTIAVFDRDRKTGLLKLKQNAVNGGKNPRHIALDPTNRWLLISDQDSGTIVIHERNRTTGELSAPVHTYPVKSKPMCIVFA